GKGSRFRKTCETIPKMALCISEEADHQKDGKAIRREALSCDMGKDRGSCRYISGSRVRCIILRKDEKREGETGRKAEGQRIFRCLSGLSKRNSLDPCCRRTPVYIDGVGRIPIPDTAYGVRIQSFAGQF